MSTHQVTLEEMRAIHHKLATSSHQKCDDTKTKDIDMNFNLKFDSFVKVRRFFKDFLKNLRILRDKCFILLCCEAQARIGKGWSLKGP